MEGADKQFGTPTLVCRMAPGEVSDLFAHRWDDVKWQLAPAASGVSPGARAVIYEAGGRGLVGYFDYASEAFDFGHGGLGAWGTAIEFDENVSRERLREDRSLARVFDRVKTGQVLHPEMSARIQELIPEASPVRIPEGPLPSIGSADLALFDVDRKGEFWDSEAEMQMALATDEQACRELGVSPPCQTEQYFDGREARFDLFSLENSTVIECKLFATARSLDQLDGYLARARKKHPDRKWEGHLVAALGADRAVIKKVSLRDDVSLWVCLKRASTGPLLERIEGPASKIPFTALARLEEQVIDIGLVVSAVQECFMDLLIEAGMDHDDLLTVVTAFEQQDEPGDVGVPDVALDETSGEERLRLTLWAGCDASEQIREAIGEIAALAGVEDERIGGLFAHVDAAADRDNSEAPVGERAVEFIHSNCRLSLPLEAMHLASTAGLPWRTMGEIHEAWEAAGFDPNKRAAIPTGEAATVISRLARAYDTLRDGITRLWVFGLEAGELSGIDTKPFVDGERDDIPHEDEDEGA